MLSSCSCPVCLVFLVLSVLSVVVGDRSAAEAYLKGFGSGQSASQSVSQSVSPGQAACCRMEDQENPEDLPPSPASLKTPRRPPDYHS